MSPTLKDGRNGSCEVASEDIQRSPILCRAVITLDVGRAQRLLRRPTEQRALHRSHPNELPDILKEVPASYRAYKLAEGSIVDKVAARGYEFTLRLSAAVKVTPWDGVQAQGRSSAMESLCPCEEERSSKE